MFAEAYPEMTEKRAAMSKHIKIGIAPESRRALLSVQCTLNCTSFDFLDNAWYEMGRCTCTTMSRCEHVAMFYSSSFIVSSSQLSEGHTWWSVNERRNSVLIPFWSRVNFFLIMRVFSDFPKLLSDRYYDRDLGIASLRAALTLSSLELVQMTLLCCSWASAAHQLFSSKQTLRFSAR